jgi:hypothetical protein
LLDPAEGLGRSGFGSARPTVGRVIGLIDNNKTAGDIST